MKEERLKSKEREKGVTHACTRVSTRIDHGDTFVSTTMNISTCAASLFLPSLRHPNIPRSRLLSVWLVRLEGTGQFMPNYILITIMARLRHRWCMELSNCRDPQLHTIASIVSLLYRTQRCQEYQIFSIKCSKMSICYFNIGIIRANPQNRDSQNSGVFNQHTKIRFDFIVRVSILVALRLTKYP